MVSIDNISERLEAIEQRLYNRGPDGIDILLDEVEAISELNETATDRIFNLRLQYLIAIGDFKGLSKIISTENSHSAEADVRIRLAKGVLSNVHKDYRQSLIYFLEAEVAAKRLDLPKLSAAIQINIGTVYASLHHYEEGLNRYQQILKVPNDLSPRSKSALLHNKGNLEYALGNYLGSIESFKKSLKINPMVDDVIGLKTQLLLLRSQLKAKQSEKQALRIWNASDALFPIYLLCKAQLDQSSSSYKTLLEEALQAGEEYDDIQTQLDASLLLIEYFEETKAYHDAYLALRTHQNIKERLNAMQASSQLTEQEVRFIISEKEAAIKTLEKETALQNEILKRNQMLEVANEDLRQFAYVVSHDLKEPLRMIGSYTQLIEMSLAAQVPSDEKTYFQYIKGGVSRLNDLLDGLSNYSTLKALQKEFETLSLRQIIEAVEDNLDVLISENQGVIELAQDFEVKGSFTLLTLLFQNLIQNAIKFRRLNEQPTIHISGNRNGHNLSIWVSDNGIGIQAEQYERIFVIFQRLHRNEAISGTGMGLAICKKIVQLHEGKISAKANEKGPGTTFLIELPNQIDTPSKGQDRSI